MELTLLRQKEGYSGTQAFDNCFDGLKERGSIIAKEIKLLCLLWIFAIQHRYFEEVYAA